MTAIQYRRTIPLATLPTRGTPEYYAWLKDSRETYIENQGLVPLKELEGQPFVFLDGKWETDPLDAGTVRKAMRFLYLHRPSLTFWGAYANPSTGLAEVEPLPSILPGGTSCYLLWPRRGEEVSPEDTATLAEIRELAAAYKEADDARRSAGEAP